MNKKIAKINTPKDWIAGKIGDFLIDIQDGGTPPRQKKEYFEGGIPWVVIRDIKPKIKTTCETLSSKGLENSSAKIFPPGTVILSFGATIGEVGIAEVELATKQGIAGVLHDNKIINTEYLYYLFQSLKKRLNQLASGSTIKEIRPSIIKKIGVLVPPLPEQKKIAEILSSVDDEIQKTDEIISATEKLKKGLRKQLLTRGIGHTRFKKTVLGEIPEGWSIKELKDVSSKIGDGLHGTPKFSDKSEYFFINGNNISNKKINLYKETKYISAEEYKIHKKELGEKTILMSINGTIGNIGFYNHENIVLGKSVAYINCDNEMDKKFIAYQLETDFITNYFKKGLTGTTIKNLSLATIRKTPIAITNIGEQKKIINILTPIEEALVLNEKIKDKLLLLKRGLMQDLLSGRKRTL